jgi:transcriptional regulator with XRE-family HTH domain
VHNPPTLRARAHSSNGEGYARPRPNGRRPIAPTDDHSSPSHDPQTFGESLRRFRAAAGLSQEALAERAGLRAHAVSDLERGTRWFPHPDTVQRLSSALELDESQSAELRSASRRRPRYTPPTTARAGVSQAVRKDRPSTEIRQLPDAWGYPLVRSTVCPTLIGRASPVFLPHLFPSAWLALYRRDGQGPS